MHRNGRRAEARECYDRLKAGGGAAHFVGVTKEDSVSFRRSFDWIEP